MIATDKIAFGAEYVADFWPEALPLMQEHWKELHHYDDVPFDPDFNHYQRLDDAQILRLFTAREDGKLIGYCVYLVQTDPHYKSRLKADQDVFFIQKDKRGFGRDFLQYCDDLLKREGVSVIYQHVKDTNDFGPMLKRIGYEPVYRIYVRRLF